MNGTITMDITLFERIIRLEEKQIAADKALDLARASLSKGTVISTITIIISVVAVMIAFFRHG